jgi:hypothetical protein
MSPDGWSLTEDEVSLEVAPFAANLHGAFARQTYSFGKVFRQ